MIDGTLHVTLLLFSTDDPTRFRTVSFLSFRGSEGLRYNPLYSDYSILPTEKVNHMMFVGRLALDEFGHIAPDDGLRSTRFLGSMTVTLQGLVVTQEVNLLLMLKSDEGEKIWAKEGIPMGWPFQMLVSQA